MVELRKILYLMLVFSANMLEGRDIKDSLHWKPYTTNEGLPNNYVNDIFQDRDGFLWIGTKYGLSKYDGYDFFSYENLRSAPTSLSSNSVTSIYEDKMGALWVGTRNGLNRLKNNRLEFDHFFHQSNDYTSLLNNHIVKIVQDSHGEMWVGTVDGTLHIFDKEKEVFLRFPSQIGEELRDLESDSHGRLILGFRKKGGVSFFDLKEGRILSHEISRLTSQLNIFSLLVDQEGILWIGTSLGVFSYREGSGALEHYQLNLPKNHSKATTIVFDLHQGSDGHIWVATDGEGIFKIDKQSGSVSWFNTFIGGLNSLAITKIFSDSTQTIWLGTVNAGLGREKKFESIIDHYTYIGESSKGISSKFVTSLFESQSGDIWIGIDQGGVNLFDREKKELIHFLHDSQNTSSLSDNIVNSIYEDSRGDLYVGTYLNGFDIKRKGEETFEHYWSNEESAPPFSKFVRVFMEDRAGDFWIGTVTAGLLKHDRNSKTTQTFVGKSNDDQLIPIEHVTFLYEDRNGLIWVGTVTGLYSFDKQTEQTRVWNTTSTGNNPIKGNLIYCINEDSLGNLWIGTDEGLNRYHPESNTFTSYDLQDGLPGSWVRAILPAEEGDLWIGTNKGICRFDLKNESFEMINIRELKNIEVYSWGGLKTRDGKLWFGTVNGIFSFFPNKIKRNPIPPDVRISSLLLKNKEILPGENNSVLEYPIERTKQIILDHEQSQVFSLGYIALSYVQSDQNTYAYRLEGFEDTWNYVGTQRQATYTNLLPGTYFFHLKASNNDGVWNEQGTTLKIIILPPWWKTWPTYTLLIVLIVLIVYGIWYSERLRMKLISDLRIAQIEKEKEVEVSQMKAQFFTNISHEFKTPLTLILGPLEQIIQSGKADQLMKKQLGMIQQNSHRLLGLVNQLMDFRKSEQGKLKLQAQLTDLVDFTNVIVESFREKALIEGITLKFQVYEYPLMIWFDKNKIDKVLFNLLSNAFRHTNAGGLIEVTVKLSDNLHGSSVEIVVRDTGEGIALEYQPYIFDRFFQVSSSNTGSGIGLALSKSIVDLHHGSIKVESEVGKGSIFVVRLPLGASHLSEEEKLAPNKQKNENDSLLLPIPTIDNETDQQIVSIDSPLVLVVEDDHELGNFIQQVLENHYFSVKIAMDGHLGLEMAIRENPDLIISDVLMPKMDGFELCRQIKSNFLTSHIPLIILTSLSGEENSITGIESGADAYIFKPFNERVLISKIQNLLLLRKKLREHFQMEVMLNSKELPITPEDERFMAKILEIIDQYISDPEFNVVVLAKEMAMSRSVLFKKIKSFAGLAPNEFIQIIKLKRAEAMLIKGGEKVADVAYKLGFSNPKTFRTQFKKHYHQTPSDYIIMHQNDNVNGVRKTLEC